MIVAAPRNEQELRNMMYTASLESFKELNQAIKILRCFAIFRNKFRKQNKLYFISLLARSIK